MARVFQYGSNMSSERLNDMDRLGGDAKVICTAKTVEQFELVFDVFSKKNKCAAANIVSNTCGRSIYGVVYDIPEFLISRETAKAKCRTSLDEIEGEGKNYRRKEIELFSTDESRLTATTYVVIEPKSGLKTSLPYVTHILVGLKEHAMPDEYCCYVLSQIIKNNCDLAAEIILTFDKCSITRNETPFMGST